MIRAYQDKDIEQLLDTWFKASSMAHPFLEDAFMAQERINTREIYIPNTKTWVYIIDHQVIGFIAMMGNEIGALFVDPLFQGQGIGSQLANHVAPFHETLEVEVFEKNKIGRAFYKKYGFQFLEKHVHEATGNMLLRLRK